jgi:hypothetical protein
MLSHHLMRVRSTCPAHPPQLNKRHTKRWYYLIMAIIFTRSAGRHGIPNEDAVYAMTHAEGREEDSRGTDVTIVFVGHPHPQTDRYIEVIATMRRPDIVVFHVMDLSDLYRHLIEGE